MMLIQSIPLIVSLLTNGLPTVPQPQIKTNSIPPHSCLLAWDAVTYPGFAGYKVYQGVASRSYTNSLNVGNVTNFTATNIDTTITNYFAVTDYDTNGNESAWSNEAVSTRFPPATNVVTFSVQILQASNTIGPYSLMQTLPAFSVTNPVGADYVRANVVVTTTNIAK